MNDKSKGYWKHGTTPKSYVRTCSVCGERSYFVGIGEYPFCPYCKAEMRQTHFELPHAEWRNGKCTNCGLSAISVDEKRRGNRVTFYTPHCPYCGAIMDNNLFNAVHGARMDGKEIDE